ncbi:MAG: hypothetical protein ACJ735_08440 [Actinomycetes bacterium]
MSRRLVVPGAFAAAAIAALATLTPAHATPRGAECQLAGSATISPGLGATQAAEHHALRRPADQLPRWQLRDPRRPEGVLRFREHVP